MYASPQVKILVRVAVCLFLQSVCNDALFQIEQRESAHYADKFVCLHKIVSRVRYLSSEIPDTDGFLQANAVLKHVLC